MKISIFTLADYVTEQAGKLIIVGAFDKLSSLSFPFIAPPFGLAVKGYLEKKDYGKKRKITIEIRSFDEKIKVFRAVAQVGFDSKQTGRVKTMTLKLMLGNIEFKTPGVYVVECKTGSRILSSIQLDVVRISAAAFSKKVGNKSAKMNKVKKKQAKKATKKKVSKKVIK